MTAILVLTNLPDQTSAQQLAETLITEKLAACVNILSPCQSIYHWEGKIESAEEWPMMIKTTTDRYAQLEIRILALHPYELPEIIQVEVKGG
jgi:periplasmic divalent cation tolerance protein